MRGFDGKIALVTGAGSGIGRAIALGFARDGARVVVADINDAAGEETVGLIGAAGGEALFSRCDITDERSVEAVISGTIARHGRLDCAVNNAGIDPEIVPEPAWELDLFDRITTINLRGTVISMKYEIAAMLESGGGTIVNLSSLAGLVGVANKPFYVASKHAVLGLTKSAALLYAGRGIRVNAVCPGMTRTPMMWANMDYIPGGEPTVAQHIPIRRSSDAEEVAEAVLWLSSERSSYVVGHALAVDGGLAAQ